MLIRNGHRYPELLDYEWTPFNTFVRQARAIENSQVGLLIHGMRLAAFAGQGSEEAAEAIQVLLTDLSRKR